MPTGKNDAHTKFIFCEMEINLKDVLPPGEGPTDPYVKEIDAIAFALHRVDVHLHWIEEHRLSFEAARQANPELAEQELKYLADSTSQARKSLNRLIELLLAGYTINKSKRLPSEFKVRE